MEALDRTAEHRGYWGYRELTEEEVKRVAGGDGGGDGGGGDGGGGGCGAGDGGASADSSSDASSSTASSDTSATTSTTSDTEGAAPEGGPTAATATAEAVAENAPISPATQVTTSPDETTVVIDHEDGKTTFVTVDPTTTPPTITEISPRF